MSWFNPLNFRKQSEEQVKALEVTDEFGVCLTELGKCQLAVISGALPERVSLSSSGHHGAARTPPAGGRHAEAVHRCPLERGVREVPAPRDVSSSQASHQEHASHGAEGEYIQSQEYGGLLPGRWVGAALYLCNVGFN